MSAEEEYLQWATELGLVHKTNELLSKHDLCDLKALKVIDLKMLDNLKLSMGQAALLVDGLKRLQRGDKPKTGGDSTDRVLRDSVNIEDSSGDQPVLSQIRADPALQAATSRLLEGSDMWSGLLNTNSQSQGLPNQTSVFDPIYYLKPRTSSKYYDVTEFISRRKGEFEEIISSKDGVEIVLRNQEKSSRKVQLNTVSVTQWNIANVSIMYQLMLDGALAQQNLPDYLAYSVKILELSYHHEWDSVLLYDREYRQKQAAYGFRWGVDPPHLSAAILVPRTFNNSNSQSKHFQKSFQKPGRAQIPRHRKLTTKNGREICLAYNSKSGCRWGVSCKYMHVCSENGCEQPHPMGEHPKA
jgi:hypothetical protein